MIKYWFRLFVVVIGFGGVIPTVNAATPDYLQTLISAAETKQLHQRPEWRKLMHYKPTLLGGDKSQVDAPRYFLAADGKTNPQAELSATLSAFFEPFPLDAEQQQLHPQCIFVARFAWLKAELGFDSAQLPHHHCQRFEEWLAALNPQGMTLVFPTAYINGPAAMFGHTLLRVDPRGQNEQNQLLSYALNFAADTGNDGGLAYAFKGLMGGYPGAFSVMPYYLKVREYSDMENREIWEYRLNLSEAETMTMLYHAWELRGIWFEYFFFDENCSYHLLSLLETARPELNLTDAFGAWAIPSDTVRVIADAGLIESIDYRPSRAGSLTHRMAGLNAQQQATIRHLATDADAPHDAAFQQQSAQEQALLLELAHEYAAYQLERGDEAAAQHMHRLLQARSATGVSLEANPPPVPAVRPEQGHGTGRISLSAGRADDHNYWALNFRPAYHDLLDPLPGYTAGAQIEFFDISLRYDLKNDQAYLQHFTPINIFSLTPASAIDNPVSWRFDIGLRQKHGMPQTQTLTSINGGAGMSWAADIGDATLFYTLANGGLDIDNELDKGYSSGLGGEAGIVSHWRDWAGHLFWRHTYYRAGHRHHEKHAAFEQRYQLDADNTLRLEWSRRQELAAPFHNIHLSWQRYF